MKIQKILGISLGVLASAVSAKAAKEVARVNNQIITLEDFDKKYRESLKFFQNNAPSKESVLDDMIKRETAVQKAKEKGLDRDPEIQDRIKTVLYHALIEKELTREFEKIQISDDEAKANYSKNPEIRTSHIFLSVKPGAGQDEDRKTLEKLKTIQNDYLKDGKTSFAEVAQRFSEGVAAPFGGDIDFQTRDKLDPAYYSAALQLKSPGKISGIVRSKHGYHIIKLTAVKSWAEADHAEWKRKLFDERRSQIFDRWIAQYVKSARVSKNLALVQDSKPSAPAAGP